MREDAVKNIQGGNTEELFQATEQAWKFLHWNSIENGTLMTSWRINEELHKLSN